MTARIHHLIGGEMMHWKDGFQILLTMVEVEQKPTDSTMAEQKPTNEEAAQAAEQKPINEEAAPQAAATDTNPEPQPPVESTDTNPEPAVGEPAVGTTDSKQAPTTE